MKSLNDVLGYKNLKIYQDDNFFSFSLDSIILGNYCTIRKRDNKILDACCGNGIIPLILSRRTNKHIIGVEILEKLSSLALESVDYNHLNNQITIVNCDIKEYAKNHLNEFDLLVCNPPYFKVSDNSSYNISYEKMIARHEILLNLNDLCDCAKKVLKDNGNICIVHRADRLMDVLYEFRNHGIEPKRIKFIHEFIDKESFLVLVEGQKCGKSGLKVDNPLILYNSDNTFTEEYKSIQLEVRK